MGEQAYGRPVVTDREVVADTIPGLDAETLQGLTPGELGGDAGDVGERLDDLEDRLDNVEAANVELQTRVAELEGLLAGVTRGDVDGHDTLQFEGMNVQVVNGSTASGPNASVSGGNDNEAASSWSSVSGGRRNTAEALRRPWPAVT